MLSYTLLLFVASVAIGLTYVVNKQLSSSSYHPASYTFLTSLVSSFLAIPLLFYNFHISNQIGFWILALISAATFGVSSLFSFKAYKISDASSVSLIHKLNIVIAAFLGIIFLGEKYNSLAYFGLTLIFLSAFTLVYEGKKISIEKGILFALIMAFTSALAGVFDKVVLKDFSPFTYVFLNNILITLLFSIPKPSIKESVQIFKRNTKLVIASSVLSVGSWATFLFVLQSTDVSRTFPIYKSLSLIVPVLAGIFILKENKKLSQKIIGTVIGAIGILFLTIAK